MVDRENIYLKWRNVSTSKIEIHFKGEEVVGDGVTKMPFFLNAELENRYLLQSPFLNLWWRRVKDRWKNHPERVCTVSGIFDNNLFESFIHFLPIYAWEHDASTSTTLFRYVQQVLEWKICGTINSWLKVLSCGDE